MADEPTATPRTHLERVEALFEKQLTFMETEQRGPMPFVPSADTTALRDLAATCGHLLIAQARANHGR